MRAVTRYTRVCVFNSFRSVPFGTRPRRADPRPCRTVIVFAAVASYIVVRSPAVIFVIIYYHVTGARRANHIIHYTRACSYIRIRVHMNILCTRSWYIIITCHDVPFSQSQHPRSGGRPSSAAAVGVSPAFSQRIPSLPRGYNRSPPPVSIVRDASEPSARASFAVKSTR